MHQGERLLAEARAGRAGVEQALERRDRAQHDTPRRYVERAERLGEKVHDLVLGGGAVTAHKLHAQLGELARLALERGLLAHDGCLVAEAHGQAVWAHARGDHARDGQREVRAQREEAAVHVEELERQALDAARALECVTRLQERRLHRKVPMRREDLAHGAGDALARERLLRKDVTEPTWCACYHACPSPLLVRRAYSSDATEITACATGATRFSCAGAPLAWSLVSCVVTLAY